MGRWRDRIDWSIVIVAATLLIVTVSFGAYLDYRRAVSDARNERQRTAICSILAALPPSPPPSLQAARAVFARPGHPSDCKPASHVPHSKRPPSSPTPTVTVTPRARILPLPAPSTALSPRSASARSSASPRPRPTPTRTPAPSPTPTCIAILCLPPR